jgi:Periplasmic component of the Tol biopolymer transport system
MAHPTVSPDGSEVGLYYDISGRNELHVLDVETGELSQWSDGEVPRNARWFVDWATGGNRVFFHRDDAGDEQNDIHALTRGGDHEVVVEMDGQSVINDVGPRGETLLFGSSRDGQMNIYRHDLPTGETTKLTEFQRAAGGATVAPDGERFAFATNESDDFDNRDVYLADVDGSDQRNLGLGENGAESGPAGWGPDGERLLVSDNTPDTGRAGVYDVAGDVRWLGDGTHEESAVSFVDGERVLVSRDRDGVTTPVVYSLESGEGRELVLPDGVAGSARAGVGGVTLADGRLVLTHTTPTTRTELLAYDLETDRHETLVEAEYGPFEPGDFADAEYFTFDSDGVPDTPQAAVEHDPYESLEIGGLLYDAGERPSPLVVNPHGGPRARDSKRFDLYTQVLVSQATPCSR